MNCENAQALFSEYSEGTLSPAMKLALEQHFESCPECQADYAAFLQVNEILKEGLPEVDVPTGFRQSVMAKIAAQPAPTIPQRQARSAQGPLESLAQAWRTFTRGLTSSPQRAFVTGVACTLLAVGIFTVLNRGHQPTTLPGGKPVIEGGLSPIQQQVPVQHTSGILQNALMQTDNGQTYHVFGIHLPLNAPPAQIKAYVLQNESGLTDDAALNNADNATVAWTGTGEQGVSIHVPVAVVSNVQPGSTLNFLVEWAPVGNDQAEQKEVAFVPIADEAAAPTPVNAGDSLYDVLQNISSSYKAKIFVDPSAVNEATADASTGASGLAALTGTEGSARAALQTALSGAGYYITDEGTDGPGGTGDHQYLVWHP
jgi:hypothetical protein